MLVRLWLLSTQITPRCISLIMKFVRIETEFKKKKKVPCANVLWRNVEPDVYVRTLTQCWARCLCAYFDAMLSPMFMCLLRRNVAPDVYVRALMQCWARCLRVCFDAVLSPMFMCVLRRNVAPDVYARTSTLRPMFTTVFQRNVAWSLYTGIQTFRKYYGER